MDKEQENWNTYLETPPNSYNSYALDSYSFPSVDNFSFSAPVTIESNLVPSSTIRASDDDDEFSVVYPEIEVNFETYGELESRTINISNLPIGFPEERLEKILKRYGPINNLTMNSDTNVAQVSFFDIRSARWLRLEQITLMGNPLYISFAPLAVIQDTKKPPNNGTIVIFHLPGEATNQVLENIFSKFGEIRQIRKTPSKRYQRFIEYYDLRAAEEALTTMNGQTIMTSRVSIEFSLPGGYRKNAIQVAPTPTIQRVKTHQWV